MDWTVHILLLHSSLTSQQPLELITDVEMHLMLECVIRGISLTSHCWTCANNDAVPNTDPNKHESYIMHLDANNLYGHSISEPLPYSEFE